MEEREISLKELFDVIWKGKWIIAISAVAVFVVAAAGAFIYDSGKSEVATVVTMQWNGVGTGEYPDGSRFDYSNAIEPYVITLATSEVDLELLTTDVRSAITITPIVPSDILAQIQAALEAGEELAYFATDYKLVLDNGSLGISVQEGTELLNEIITQFRLDFERTYINQMSIYDFTDADYAAFDYIDSYDILNAQVEAIDSAMEPREDSGFYSGTLGITFSDILVRTDLLNRIEMTQIVSRVNNYLLTKDDEFLVTNYQYKIQVKQLALDKAIAKEQDISDLVDGYTGSVQTILIPGLDSGEFDIDTYYNTLMDKLVTYQSEIAEHTEDIAYYQLQIDRLNGDDPLFAVTEAKQLEEIVKVDANIIQADVKLESIVNDANILLSEYNEYLTSNIIKPLLAPEYQSSVSVMMISAIGLVLGAGIGAVVVLFKNDWN